MDSVPLYPEQKGIAGWRFLLLLKPDVFQTIHDLPNRGFYWEHGAQESEGQSLGLCDGHRKGLEGQEGMENTTALTPPHCPPGEKPSHASHFRNPLLTGTSGPHLAGHPGWAPVLIKPALHLSI